MDMASPYFRGDNTVSSGLPSGTGVRGRGQWEDDQIMRAPTLPSSSRGDPRLAPRDPRQFRDQNNRAIQQRVPQGISPGGEPKPNSPNDCEIIVMGKQLQQYAERVEKALKDIGLKVDLMFPKPEVAVQTFIENIASMGAGFAAVIKPDNESHQSLSLHVLKGVPKPEEHRNMPLQAALNLIQERFALIRRADFGPVSPRFLELIALVADGQFIPDKDYKYIMNHLHERWSQQKMLLNETEYDPESDIPSVKEVSAKILQVLGMDAEGNRANLPSRRQQQQALSATSQRPQY